MGNIDKIKNYPKTEHFEAVDVMGVPHPYCLDAIHVRHAHDHFSGALSHAAIHDLESKRGPKCGVKGCNLSFDEHEQAVAIRCTVNDDIALKAYCESLVPLLQRDGFVGFIFIKAW